MNRTRLATADLPLGIPRLASALAIAIVGVALAGCMQPASTDGAPPAAPLGRREVLEVLRFHPGEGRAGGANIQLSAFRDGDVVHAAIDDPSRNLVHLLQISSDGVLSEMIELGRPIDQVQVGAFAGRPFLAFRNAESKDAFLLHRAAQGWEEVPLPTLATTFLLGVWKFIASREEFALVYYELAADQESVTLLRLTDEAPSGELALRDVRRVQGLLPFADAAVHNTTYAVVGSDPLATLQYQEGAWSEAWTPTTVWSSDALLGQRFFPHPTLSFASDGEPWLAWGVMAVVDGPLPEGGEEQVLLGRRGTGWSPTETGRNEPLGASGFLNMTFAFPLSGTTLASWDGGSQVDTQWVEGDCKLRLVGGSQRPELFALQVASDGVHTLRYVDDLWQAQWEQLCPPTEPASRPRPPQNPFPSLSLSSDQT